MNKTRREIECLSRLQQMTSQLDNILMFLRQEELVDDQQIKTTKQSPDFAKDIQAVLRDLQVRNKLQLLEYTWTILPVENIRLYIVTDRNQQEFVYNG